ncbi:MAG: AEC family transporter [Candidatus Omnitrophota bacterium]
MVETFFTSFKTTSFAVFEILILGLCGFIILKRNFITVNGLDIISKLVVEVTLPLFVFTQLLLRFKFSLYPNWYIFPTLSLLINFCGFIIGFILLKISGAKIPQKREFLALSTFQNSGYLVFPLVVALLPKDRADELLIYVFLFLLGFNLLIWSLGVFLLSNHKRKGFELGSLFSPAVVAILLGLLVTALGLDRLIPDMVIRPLKLIGECTIPLAMLVVGGSLALIDFSKAAMKIGTLVNIVLAKLVLLPFLALFILYKFKLTSLVGLLIMLEAAVPSATTLSLISRHYKVEGADFINQGIFWTHLLSIFTIPLFLSLFFVISGI